MYVFASLAGIWYAVLGFLILTRGGPAGVMLGLIIAACGCVMVRSSARARRGDVEAPRHVRRSSSTILAVVIAAIAWWVFSVVRFADYAMVYAARDHSNLPLVAAVILPAIIVLLGTRRSRVR